MPLGERIGDDVASDVEANVKKKTSLKLCARCDEIILESDPYTLECFGRCKETIHWNCFPNGTHEELDVLRKMKNAVYACDTCIALHEFDDTEEMQTKMNEVLHGVAKLQRVLDFVEGFDVRVRKIVREELVESGKIPVTPTCDPVRYNLRSTSKAKRENGRMENRNNPPVNGTVVNNNINYSFADVVKTSKPVVLSKDTPKTLNSKNEENNNKAIHAVSPKKPNSRIVIKPKTGKNASETKKLLSKKVKPSNFRVKDIYTRKDGSILVDVQDHSAMLKLKETIEKELCDHCEVEVSDTLKPTLKIVGINEEMNEDELKTTLIENNEVMENVKHFKVKSIVAKDKENNDNFDAIIEVDAITFHKVLKQKKIMYGWERCQVVDALDVVQCYKCCGFNHKSVKCTARKEACPRCAGEHLIRECNSSEVKCINCERSKLNGDKDADSNHCAWSERCPLYMRMKERKRQMIDYSV